MSPIADPNPSVSIGLHAAYRFKLDVQLSLARSRAMVSARPGVDAWLGFDL
jgi:hypothetical protein